MMKRIVLLALLLCSADLMAQSLTLGTGYHIVNVLFNDLEDITNGYFNDKPIYSNERKLKGTVGGWSAHFGFDMPVFKFNVNSSVGFSANVGLLANTQSKQQEFENLGATFNFDFPEYITYNYGYHASKDALLDFGFTVGAGYRYTKMPYSTSSPSVMLEGVYQQHRLRLCGDVLKSNYYSYYTGTNESVPTMKLQQFSIQYFYQFSN